MVLKKFRHVTRFLPCLALLPPLSLVAAQTPEPYTVVHGWPQLPAGFALGQISGVAVDSHNHVFVFNRAENSWPGDPEHPTVIASPAVLCFDGASGKLVTAWGKNRFLRPHGL